ncbi:type II toxin-antitoxin system VapC family toxin [soil metagenome]
MTVRLLLDSHVFMWLAQDEGRLLLPARDAIASAAEIFLSTVSIAELCIKSGLGKLILPGPVAADPAAGFRQLAQAMGVTILPLDVEPAAALNDLPHHHRDPFDRLLVAQAMVAGLTLVTHDRQLRHYAGLDIVWT